VLVFTQTKAAVEYLKSLQALMNVCTSSWCGHVPHSISALLGAASAQMIGAIASISSSIVS
jgi:hypothetical protein